MAASELTDLFKKALGAADSGEKARCVEALRTMRALPVTTALLQSTQVGKQLRRLTKNPEPDIRSIANEILEDWKKIVTNEAKSPKAKPAENKGKFEAPSSNGTNGNATNGTSKLKIPKTNDPARDKVRESLMEAFSKVPQEAGPGFCKSNDPIRAAVDVETALYQKLGTVKTDRRGKYRSILFNLKDANNPDFRRRVFLGEIQPTQMTTMSSEDMASDQRKAENKQIKDKAMFECERGMKQEATTNEFKCGKCGKRECTYYQKQIRSADEPMTTFVTCVNCNNRWKFC